MDVKCKRKLVAMAAALEIAAEDYYDDECGFMRRKRSVWVKPWLTRKSLSMQNQLYQELLASNPEEYKRLLRLSCEQFDQLLALIQPWIWRQDTAMRSSVILASADVLSVEKPGRARDCVFVHQAGRARSPLLSDSGGPSTKSAGRAPAPKYGLCTALISPTNG
ncbi:hypothetical protein HPB50_009334 [Hyalomma asiaticum]|uniref:Uncharacterized protein n=1 Tax=Hyalomma asiaticum TaxID=266040 RepID=A0ACB7S1D4_HYAAI|nr:hypothetical protein HPB50_009334 [Hyalomma asiaticum]